MTPEICSDPLPLYANADGVLLVAGTYVPIDTLVYRFEQGAAPENIVNRFPTLNLVGVLNVIGSSLRHREEIEAYFKEREVIREAVRIEVRARFDLQGLLLDGGAFRI